MAELASYLSIVPHMRSFDVPPKHSAPLTQGLFLRDFLRRENEKSPAGDAPRFATGIDGGLPRPGRGMTKTILVEAVTHRSAVQKITVCLGWLGKARGEAC